MDRAVNLVASAHDCRQVRPLAISRIPHRRRRLCFPEARLSGRLPFCRHGPTERYKVSITLLASLCSVEPVSPAGLSRKNAAQPSRSAHHIINRNCRRRDSTKGKPEHRPSISSVPRSCSLESGGSLRNASVARVHVFQIKATALRTTRPGASWSVAIQSQHRADRAPNRQDLNRSAGFGFA